ncbi:hypothetical protein AaE_009198, partial [Aphanomyces astaci]
MAGSSQPLLGMSRGPRARPYSACTQSPYAAIVIAIGVGIVIVVAGQFLLSEALGPPTAATYTPNFMDPRPNTGNCSLHWFDQRLDHFTTLNATYKQRYFVYDKFWKRQADGHKEDGPIFFYCGNEADVTLYVNSTGLMWENAQALGALLVFAEHRYFGTLLDLLTKLDVSYHALNPGVLGHSIPFGDQYKDHLQYLTHDQALADYALVLRSLQQQHRVDVPVIA